MNTNNIYRIYPVLWSDGTNTYNVYGIDRILSSTAFKAQCSQRIREDPACIWDSRTFQRLIPPGNDSTYPISAITWSNLPSWLSYVQTLGYSLNIDFSKLKPYSDLYISGP